jgi:hypothetical protein
MLAEIAQKIRGAELVLQQTLKDVPAEIQRIEDAMLSPRSHRGGGAIAAQMELDKKKLEAIGARFWAAVNALQTFKAAHESLAAAHAEIDKEIDSWNHPLFYRPKEF